MNELKKLLIKRKLLLVIALGLALKVVLCLMETPAPPLQPPSAQNEYEQILANLAGPLTPEKEAFFAEEEDRRAAYQEAMDAVWDRYDNGEISEEELGIQLSAVSNPAEVSDEAWAYLQNQYAYIQEDPTLHYFIRQDGWVNMLGSQSLDYILLLLILIISGTGITYEYESGMAELLWTNRKGQKQLIASKLACILLLCTGVFLLSEGITALNEILRYGPLPDAPLQSLRMFQNSSLQVDLITVYLASRGYRLLGVLLTAAITMFLAVLGRRAVTALFGGLAFAVVPYFLWGGKDLLFRYPNPAGLLIGSGYFFSDILDSSGAVFYKAVTSTGHILTIGFTVLCLCLLSMGTVLLFKRKQERRRQA